MSKNFIVLDKIREKLQNYLQGEDLLTQPRKGKKKNRSHDPASRHLA